MGSKVPPKMPIFLDVILSEAKRSRRTPRICRTTATGIPRLRLGRRSQENASNVVSQFAAKSKVSSDERRYGRSTDPYRSPRTRIGFEDRGIVPSDPAGWFHSFWPEHPKRAPA